MKSYNETVNSVFRRIEKYETVKKQKRKILAEAGLGLCCVCMIAVIGISSQRTAAKSSAAEKQPSNVNTSNLTTENQNVNGIFIPANPDGHQNTADSEISMRLCPSTIYSYPCPDEDKYRAPKNGEIVMSLPLNSAIAEYGDSVYYAVEIFILKNEAHLNSKAEYSREYERISKILNNGKLGLSVSKDSNGQSSYMLLGHVSKDCLDNFPVSDKYGYFIQLSGDADEFTKNFNVVNGALSNTSP